MTATPGSRAVLLPFGQTRPSRAYLGDGWTLVHREAPGAPMREGSALGEGGIVESWCGSKGAGVVLELERMPTEDLVVALNLRGIGVPGMPRLAVDVSAGSGPAHRFAVHRAYAETKLLVVGPEACRDRVLELRLVPEPGVTRSWEIADALETEVACELSALAVHESAADCLAWIQGEFDAVRAYRDELFERGVEKLEDRGQLPDKVLVTLAHLTALDGPGAFAVAPLEAFLNDPHVQGRGGGDVAFDMAYVAKHREALQEGHVMQWIREWRANMAAFHEGVVKIGNRAFLARGEHRPGNTRVDDPLADLVAGIDLPRERLRHLKDRNDHLNTLELLLRRDALESVVPSLEIEMSSFCNYACVMCGRSWYSFQFARQSDAQLLEVLQVMPYLRHITIAGVGENTTSDRLEVFARMTEALDVETRIFTNASWIHRQLEALSRFDKVCVSFDGGTKETFETQRRGASFERVLANIRLLRERAPDRTLAFSTVVSRINLLELHRIAELAVELGVDHVAFSPVWEVEELMLRASDRPVFEAELARAREIAEAGGVVLQVNVNPEDFEVTTDRPLDVEATRRFAAALEFPSLTVPSWDALEGVLPEGGFPYHPDPRLFPGGRHPEPPPGGRRPAPAAARAMRFDFDLEAAIAETEAAIARAEAELATRPADELEIPYCLSLWKYTYMHANGNNRLCPQVFTDVGNVGRHGMRAVTNGDKNRSVRRTMYGGDLLDHCQRCMDPYRRWSHGRVVEQVAALGHQVRDRSAYSIVHTGGVAPGGGSS